MRPFSTSVAVAVARSSCWPTAFRRARSSATTSRRTRSRSRRAQASERGLGNLSFKQRDLSTFDVDAEPEAFDFVATFDAVHDQAKPLALLKGIRRTLKPGGTYLMQDIQGSSHHHENLDHPGGPLMYMISTMHCMTVSLAQGGDGLGAMWGEQKARELLAEAGFSSVAVHLLDHDPFNAYFVVRP